MSDIRKYMKDINKSRIGEDEIDEEQLERKLKRHKRGKLTKVILLVAVLVVVAFSYYIYMENKIYKEYQVTNTVEVNDTYNCNFYPFGDYMLRYSEDGLAYLNGSKTYWNQAFQMKKPLIDVCNEYVAMADYKGNDIYICIQSLAREMSKQSILLLE